MIDAGGDRLRCARDSFIPTELRGAERLFALLRPVLVELTQHLGQIVSHRTVHLFLALPESRPGHSAADEAKLSTLQRDFCLPGGMRVAMSIAGTGHAGALHALQKAAAMVSMGTEEVAIAGGVDSYLHVDTLDWLESLRRLSRSGVAGGFIPGEGAGLVALATEATCRRLRLASLATLRSVFTTQEPRSIDSDEGLLGEGLADAIQPAIEGTGGARAGGIDDILCDINGERWRTDDWAFCALRTIELYKDPTAYRTAVSEWGDVGAASGVLNCILAVQGWQRRYASGPLALVWGASWSGLRGAAVLEREGQ